VPASAATSAPPVVVLSKLPEAIDVIAKFVVVASTKSAVEKCDVEDAMMPSVNESGVVVELDNVLKKLVLGVNGNVPPAPPEPQLEPIERSAPVESN